MLLEELAAQGWRARSRILSETSIAYCTGCFECWTRTPGLCKTRDAGRELATEMIGSDLAVLLTPVTFGGYSSHLKKALDRMICLVSPFFTRIEGEVHHRKRYDRYPSLFGLGWLAEPDAEEERIFGALVARNALNFHAPRHVARVVYGGQDAAEIVRPMIAWLGRAA